MTPAQGASVRTGLLSRLGSAPGGPPVLVLAPMEGISEANARELLSGLGGMDFCVSEFIRVAQRPVPRSLLLREVPELLRGGLTASGTPVFVQLLGGDPGLLAESALTAVELQAFGIDLNFGCPAKRVNGSDGGAALLKEPRRVESVVSAVRSACPNEVPVSAKIRLGWEEPGDVFDLVKAVEAGGASFVTIHARTRRDQYVAKANWSLLREAIERAQLPVIANGDIFTPDDLERCKAVTGARAFMLGRGAFRRPNLFRWIRGLDPSDWSAGEKLGFVSRLVRRLGQESHFGDPRRAALGRLKGWVRALADGDPGLEAAFQAIKRSGDLDGALWTLETLDPSGTGRRALGPTEAETPGPRD